MSETMTISEALDERDYLAEKIAKDINNLDVITVKRVKDPRTEKGVSVEDYKKKGAALYQSIIDQIARYKRINIAIVLSNASTKIKLRSGEEMTVAEAISRKKMICQNDDLESKLYNTLVSQNNNAVHKYDQMCAQYEAQRRDLMQSLLTSTHSEKLDQTQIDSVETMVEGSVPEIIDAVATNDRTLADIVNSMSDKLNNMVKEINSAIKISNATTVIEF